MIAKRTAQAIDRLIDRAMDDAGIVAAKVICHTCNKTKVQMWVSMKRRWPRCCGWQMDMIGTATKTKANDAG